MSAKKDKYWFEHDSNARHDPKILQLRMDHGWEGYGLWWGVVETLRHCDGYRLPASAINALCFDLRCERTLIDYMIEIGLLVEDDNCVWSPALVSRMEKWDKKKSAKIEAGRKGGISKAKASSAKAKRKQNSSKTLAKASTARKNIKQGPSTALAITEQNRTEQNKTEHNTTVQVDKTIDPSLRDGSCDTVTTLHPENIQTSMLESTVTQAVLKQTQTPKSKTSRETKSGSTWNAYASAYEKRWDVQPIRNAKSNALCCQLVDLLGTNNAPLVAAYYLTSNNSVYARGRHPLALLVRDAQSIYTEYQTGQRMTQTSARDADRLQSTGDGWQQVIDKRGE